VSTASQQIRSLFLEGPAGRLEALLNEGQSDATRAALVCHPHPLFGGTMHNKVVFHAMKALHSFGFPVLRFNFRGAGRSEGKHDEGRGEVDDVRTALDWLAREFSLPILFCGFSFGAATGLKAACPDPHVDMLISLGTPVQVQDRGYGYQFLKDCAKPKLFVSGNHDQYGPRAQLQRMVATLPGPKKLVFVEGDHFFLGHLPDLRQEIEKWVGQFVIRNR
jgi:alpha/beta superfamily hydrolase